jgi:hypothetical protein
MGKKKPAKPRWYRYVADCDDYMDFHPPVSEYERLKEQLLAGKRIGRRWKPPKVTVTRRPSEETPQRAKQRPDLAMMAVAPVFSPRAWEALGPLLGDAVEALPFHCLLGEYFLINVLEVVDALDVGKSDAAFRLDGNVMMIYAYAFRPEALRDKHLFRLPETRWIEMIVSEEFKAAAKAAKLEGLIFEKLSIVETQRPKKRR